MADDDFEAQIKQTAFHKQLECGTVKQWIRDFAMTKQFYKFTLLQEKEAFCDGFIAGVGYFEGQVLAVYAETQRQHKQQLRDRLFKLRKPRAGSIYSIEQEEGMMLLLAELITGKVAKSRDEVEGRLLNLRHGTLSSCSKTARRALFDELLSPGSSTKKVEGLEHG